MTEPYKPISNDGFSLVPAIFVPFNGISKDDPIPKDRDGKLRRILEDLEKHQNAVRRNMMCLAVLQKEKLLSDAKEALERERATDASSSSEPENQSDDHAELEQSIKDLLESIREPAVRGTSGKEYEYQDGDFDIPAKDAAQGVTDVEGDATMGGMDGNASKKRNIPHELSTALQELVMGTASQIEMYDKHAETTKDYYRRALERHSVREAIVTGTTTTAVPPEGAPTGPARDRRPGGILRHTNSEIRVNTEALARIAKEDQSNSPNEQAQTRTAVDVSRDPRRRGSVQFAMDGRKSLKDTNKDVWRR